MQAPSTRSFGQDDDSIMHKLVHELDVDSAVTKLQRLGFTHHRTGPDGPQQRHLFTRNHGEQMEALILAADSTNTRFRLSWSHGQDARDQYDDVITTWDEWMKFVHMLILRPLIIKCTKQKDADDPLKRQA